MPVQPTKSIAWQNWIDCFYAYHNGLSPARKWDYETFCNYGEDALSGRFLTVCGCRYLNSTYLKEWYKMA
jgi:hypothetical protein